MSLPCMAHKALHGTGTCTVEESIKKSFQMKKLVVTDYFSDKHGDSQ